MIFTGDELLRGETVNTNQAFLGERLLDLGIFPRAVPLVSWTTWPISWRPSTTAWHAGRSCSSCPAGSVPPRTISPGRPCRRPWDGRWSTTKNCWRRSGRASRARDYVMTDSNRKQAHLPRGATAIPISGTAPGFTLEEGGTLVVALPGVPWELKEMWTGTLEPLLRTRLQAAGSAGHVVRRVRTFGIGESTGRRPAGRTGVAGRTGGDRHPGPSREPLHHPEGDRFRRGTARLERVQARVCELLGEKVFGIDSPGLPEIVGELLAQAGLTVAAAESCTGGLVAKYLTDIPGSSEYLLGGVVAYSNDVKTKLLGVDERLLAAHGAVSREVAEQMALGATRALGAAAPYRPRGSPAPAGVAKRSRWAWSTSGAWSGVVRVDRVALVRAARQIRERAALSALDQLRRRCSVQRSLPQRPAVPGPMRPSSRRPPGSREVSSR